ncbi:long-chain fatty acid transport protein [Limnobacter thiooxidans]|uniref:Outer membrane protein transport protein n=1 Tax=Limnobacter thiooxidans TaxID=131080 RepID=A0AA86ME29_9BURK|nr:long-chain fatty acid transport protein [Limnobacter thiooxidans]BET25420.1 outer membrane protein transport protein [Limnobacter thiooxidans]
MKYIPFKFSPLHIAVATLGLGIGSISHAAGFALLEQNASGAGVAYAGKAAIAEDASAAWFNPASMARLKERQVVLGGHYVDLNAEFHNEGSTTPPAMAGNPGRNVGDFGAEGYIPNFHLVVPFNDKINFGLSVATPFGLKTDYQQDWIGRFQGITSDIKTLNINPSASYQINDQWSVGAGVSAEKLDAKLSASSVLGAGVESLTTIAGDGWGYGFNLGAMGQITPATRVGVAYRSAIEHDLKGNVTFAGAGVLNSDLAAKIRLPASLALSSVTALDSRWQVLTDATWTEWSTIQQLNFQRVNAVGPAAGVPIPVQDYEWKNSWRFAVGGIYKYSDTINLKAGVAYDITPVPDERRKVRLPDENRITLALGSQYKFDKATTFDVAFQYVMPDKAKIDSTEGAGGTQSRVLGTVEGDAIVLSGQVAYKF